MASILTNDESNSGDQSGSLSNEDDRNCVAFASIVKSDLDKDSEKIQNASHSEGAEVESKDEKDIHGAYE